MVRQVLLSGVVTLLITPLCWAQPKITGPSTIAQYKMVKLKVEGSDPSAGYIWDVDTPSPLKRAIVKPSRGGDEDSVDIEEWGSYCYFVGPPGNYRVKVRVISFDTKEIITLRHSVLIMGQVPPDPPDPGPGPKPPDPPGPKPPTPGPSPISGTGLQVLLIEESADRAKLPEKQLQILASPAVKAYLNSHCGPDDDYPKAWAFFDKDVDTSGLHKKWQDAVKRPRTQTPWLIIASNSDKGSYEGPLPASVEEMLTLLKKYGGE
jgi:hypothetical protein